MRLRLVCGAGALLFLIAPSVAMGGDVEIPTQAPASLQEAKKVINQQIIPALEAAKCGGWDTNVSVDGAIAQVGGVPGRPADWDGNILSGMATRLDVNGNQNVNDDYQFPQNTRGLVTACQTGEGMVQRTVWRPGGIHPGEIVQVQVQFSAPRFSDPPCRWRLGDLSDTPPMPLPDNTPLNYAQLTDPTLMPPGDRQTPQQCVNFCRYLNRFQYRDCFNVAQAVDPVTGVVYNICLREENRYLCTNAWVLPQNGQTFEQENQTVLCPDSLTANSGPLQPVATMSNSRKCVGSECRTDRFDNADPGTWPYWSYFRRYLGGYIRKAIQKTGEKDVAWNTAPVACYGSYNEYDTRTSITNINDRRCIINMDVSGMKQSQEGRGTFGEASNLFDPNPALPQFQRPDDTTWYVRLARAFSLLLEKPFDEQYGKDLTDVYLDSDALDTAMQVASVQLTQSAPVARSSTVRAFDDTGEDRIVVQWWQKQEQEVAELVHRPVVRLLLPAGWSFGADVDNPALRRISEPSAAGEEGRAQRIELQIDADEDALGTAMAVIERSRLFTVVEEPVPLVVPMGSPAEFRAKAQAWCSWLSQQSNTADCLDGAPSEIKDLIATLESYADNIENVRKLRADTAEAAGSILALQAAVTKPVSDWVSSVLSSYLSVVREQRDLANMVAFYWRPAQADMQRFHDETNMPWCMNQRYTAPIYSLLDWWLPSRGGVYQEGRLTGSGLPNLSVERPEDLILDLSSISTLTGSISIPVWEPIQIRIDDIPLPPHVEKIKPLPPLPDIDALRARMQLSLDRLPVAAPAPALPPAPTIQPIGSQAAQEIATTLLRIRQVIIGMTESYHTFWRSLGPLRPEDDSNARDSIPAMKQALACKSWGSQPCVHVELDLLERFMRIGSRPMVQLKEDYDSIGFPRFSDGACLPSDDRCTPVHPEASGGRELWQIRGTVPEGDIEQLRSDVRWQTLPVPVGGIEEEDWPPYSTDPSVLYPRMRYHPIWTSRLLAPLLQPRLHDAFITTHYRPRHAVHDGALHAASQRLRARQRAAWLPLCCV